MGVLMKSHNPSCSAQKILDKLKLTEIPIDPSVIAKKLGARVEKDFDFDRMDESGRIEKIDGEYVIWINPIDAPVRQRFTLAHELGHLELHLKTGKVERFEDTPVTLYRIDKESNPQEWEANRFAAELLMPSDKVKEVFEELNEYPLYEEYEVIESMAKKFEVSQAAMRIRLMQINLIQKI